MATDISEREHALTVRIAVLEEKVNAAQREKILQAQEYERRLSELNHAHEKQVKDQSTYVSDDRFNGFMGQFSTLRDTVNTYMSGAEGRSLGTNRVTSMIFQFVPWLIAIAAILWKR
jgi:oligoendopeptidase F